MYEVDVSYRRKFTPTPTTSTILAYFIGDENVFRQSVVRLLGERLILENLIYNPYSEMKLLIIWIFFLFHII